MKDDREQAYKDGMRFGCYAQSAAEVCDETIKNQDIDDAWGDWKRAHPKAGFQSVDTLGYSESGCGEAKGEQLGAVEVSSDDGYVFDFGSREKIAYNCTRCSEVGILPLTNYCPYCGAYVKWVG